MTGRFRVGVDIGGTFTDIVLLDADGRIHTKKVSSSVDDYARAIVEGLGDVFRETGLAGPDVAEVLHGTTVASNAILELKGARTGLITTKGFRDVLEIRRIRMPKLYDLSWEKPVTLVERYLRLEVDPARVARDVRNEFVSRGAASDDYGVVFVGDSFDVDEIATAARPAALRAQRGWTEPPAVSR